MQIAHIRLYQGRFFLIPANEVEAFDKCRETLETTRSTSEMSKAHLEYAETWLQYEVQKVDIERLRIVPTKLIRTKKDFEPLETEITYKETTKDSYNRNLQGLFDYAEFIEERYRKMNKPQE